MPSFPTLATLPQRAAPPVLPAGCPMVCLSHLRWNFVYQRPQHLLTRFAKSNPVLYVEEPVPDDEGEARLEVHLVPGGVRVVVPRLPSAECVSGHHGGEARWRELLSALVAQHAAPDGKGPIVWYYTPMGLGAAKHLDARLVVYDCMDQLANFQNPPTALRSRERALLARADLVFTGGHSLFDAKRKLHARTHLFPSSVDAAHFRRARTVRDDPPDMAALPPGPRIGFFGVIDERLDTALIGAIAAARPSWQLVMVGPVVKIDPLTLPRAANVHYLGAKHYDDLPRYLGRWDVAIMPFAMNASTSFISPTKTPEYLAGGCPVVSTPVTDVVRAYGRSGLVHIALGADEFIAQVEAALQMPARSAELCRRADTLLAGDSWDRTQSMMTALMAQRLNARPMSGTRETFVRQPLWSV